MRRTERDTPINAARTSEFLDIDASNEPPETVANEVNAATADVSPEVLTQSQCGSFALHTSDFADAGAGLKLGAKDVTIDA